MWQELTTAKRASSCPFAFSIHTEQKKKLRVLKSSLFVKGQIATGGGWVQGTAKPASAEKQGQAIWFLISLKN